ncbi:MAG: NosD domain-containing protein [Thermofilaceae archaeon]
MTYTLTDDITTVGIIIERDNIILDGNGYTVRGVGEFEGIILANRRNVIVRNLKVENFEIGIHVIESSNITITGNTIRNNDIVGIRLDNSSGNTITGNTIAGNNQGGIYLDNSSGNTITGNILSNNNVGIYLDNSSGNRVFLNNFSNYSQVYSEYYYYSVYSVNVWDDGSRGNFWSDYKGSDVNNDGVGDTPYTIDEMNVDRYPLIRPICPYEVFSVKVSSPYGTTSVSGVELVRLRVLEGELEKVKGYLSRLEEEWRRGTVSTHAYEILKKEYQAKIEQLESEVKKIKERIGQG